MLKIHPVKWSKANLLFSGLFNRVNWKLVWSFVITLFIPLLYILNILIAVKSSVSISENIQLKLLGLIVAFFGLVFWVVSYLNLGTSFGVLPQKQQRTNKGLYKYFNHPMYIGISAVMIGLSLAKSSFYGLVFYCLVILPILVIRARFEEKNLEN